MLHLQEIADGVVDVLFLHNGPWRCRLPDEVAGCSIRRRVWARADRSDPEVFTAGGLDKAIQRIIEVVVTGFDTPVIEEDGLVRIVTDMGDVADGIVGVVQVLQTTALAGCRRVCRAIIRKITGPPGGLQMDQPEGIGIITVKGACPIAIFDQGALAFGIIVYVGHGLQVGGARVEQSGRFRHLIQPGVEALQQIGLVIDGLDDVAPGIWPVAVGGDHWIGRFSAS